MKDQAIDQQNEIEQDRLLRAKIKEMSSVFFMRMVFAVGEEEITSIYEDFTNKIINLTNQSK